MNFHKTGRAWRRALTPTAEDATWSIREAAWGFEERVLWRGADVARDVQWRAHRRLAPLQRLIQTKLTWPLADALRDRSEATRATIAASAAVVAMAAATVGAMKADNPVAQHRSLPVAQVAVAAPESPGATVLSGVTPQFQPGHASVRSEPAGKPSAPPAQVSWEFAQAFVGYEVGQTNDETNTVFTETATKQLAKALGENPPRLPANGKVPKARVLNVVLGAAAKDQVTASVSIVRLRAISEIRLILTKTGDAWRVAQVLG
jgi:hypothetical protein